MPAREYLKVPRDELCRYLYAIDRDIQEAEERLLDLCNERRALIWAYDAQAPGRQVPPE